MDTIYVEIAIDGINTVYEPTYISFGDNCVNGCSNSRAMSFLLGYCTSKEEEERRKKPIQAQMDQYNDAVKHLWGIPGFKEYFAEHNSYVTFDEIEKKFGKEAVKNASKICKITNCYPDLMVCDGVLRLRDIDFIARYSIDGEETSFGVESALIDTFTVGGKICSLDWSNDGTDRLMAWFNQFKEDEVLEGTAIDHEFNYICSRFEDDRCFESRYVIAMNYCLSLLEKRGYLHQFALKTKEENKVWNDNTNRDDNSVLLTVLDPSYKKDKLLCERLNCLWNSLYIFDNEYEDWADSDIDFEKPFYFLKDKENNMYVSNNKANYGGHAKLKIYGRLDCPSANRYVKSGKYVQHRVFFEDEDTAIAAGYRPCGVCMPEAYKKWKEANE